MKENRSLYQDEVRKMKYEDLLNTLRVYEQRGIRVCVQGVTFPVNMSAEIMTVNENECYMPDIIMNNLGKIIEINFDRIVLT